jgi:hypothetical protein
VWQVKSASLAQYQGAREAFSLTSATNFLTVTLAVVAMFQAPLVDRTLSSYLAQDISD